MDVFLDSPEDFVSLDLEYGVESGDGEYIADRRLHVGEPEGVSIAIEAPLGIQQHAQSGTRYVVELLKTYCAAVEYLAEDLAGLLLLRGVEATR